MYYEFKVVNVYGSYVLHLLRGGDMPLKEDVSLIWLIEI